MHMSLLDHFKVITVTHHQLDISDIGNFYVQLNDNEPVYDRLKAINNSFEIEEMMYMETCNRVCFILYFKKNFTDEFLKNFFKEVNPGLVGHSLNNIRSFANTFEGEAALRHIFEMASSMDSLVIGEREIFRQFRHSYDNCKSAGLTGDNIRILEKLTVATAKKIYSNTKIAEKALSVVSLAIQSMLSENENRNQRILLIGSGETNALAGKFLKKYQFNNISIYNRSLDNARQLANTLNASSHHLNELEKLSGGFDTIIICTSANQVVIDNNLYKTMIKDDKSSKLIIDLAVPRNVSEELVEKNDVKYIDISRLKHLAEINLEYRRKELERAQPIITEQLIAFKELYQQRQLERALAHIPQKIKAIKTRALNEVYAERLKSMDKESIALLNEMMDYMEKKCISVPIKAAKSSVS